MEPMPATVGQGNRSQLLLEKGDKKEENSSDAQENPIDHKDSGSPNGSGAGTGCKSLASIVLDEQCVTC